MDLQQANVAGREAGVGADLDTVAAGRGVGHDAVGQLHAHLAVLEVLAQALAERVHRLAGVERLLVAAEDRLVREVVQHVRHHVAQVGQVRVAGVEAVGGAAVQPLGNLAEGARAAVAEHAHHLAVLLAHAGHDLAGAVVLAQLAAQVALDGVELVLLGLHVEG